MNGNRRLVALIVAGGIIIGALAFTAQARDGEPPTSVAPSLTSGPVATAAATTRPTAVSAVPATAATVTTSTPVSTTPVSTTPSTLAAPTTTTIPAIQEAGETVDTDFRLRIRVESRIPEMSTADFRELVMITLNDERGWRRAGVTFELDETSPLLVVVAYPAEVDALCDPLRTRGRVSCQNGAVVALNSDRWLTGPEPDKGWDSSIEVYRSYLINHEVGHLFGLRHPTSRCPIAGGRAAVMEQQTGGLVGCRGNGWPLDWEIEWAARRPAMIAPLPEWDGPFPENPGDQATD